MAGASAMLYVIYFFIIVATLIKVFTDYAVRQLIKANFWLNVATFALIAFLTLVILNEILL